MGIAMTFSFLFWNVFKKPLDRSIVPLCLEREVDFLMIAEPFTETVSLLDQLNKGNRPYWPVYGQHGRFAVFTRHPTPEMVKLCDIPMLDETDRVTPKKSDALFIRAEIGPHKFNLVILHLRSKLRAGKIDQMTKVRIVNQRIRLFERFMRDDNTLVVGDFNLDPFDEAMVMADGFHALMNRNDLSPAGRIVNGFPHPFFYNPMWNQLGCETVTGHPPGTYYYAKGENLRYYWHLFDQVLLRPGLMAKFRDADLELVEHDGRSPLRHEGKPDSRSFSDHLPIFFKLSF